MTNYERCHLVYRPRWIAIAVTVALALLAIWGAR